MEDDSAHNPSGIVGYGMYFISLSDQRTGTYFYLDLRSTDYNKVTVGDSIFDMEFVYDPVQGKFVCGLGTLCINFTIEIGDTVRVWEEKANVNENYGAFEPTRPEYVNVTWDGIHPKILWWASEPSEAVTYDVFRKLCLSPGCGGSWQKINSSAITDTFYVDINVTSGISRYIYYKTRSRSGDGSKLSSFVNAQGNPIRGSLSAAKATAAARLDTESYLRIYNSPNPFNPVTTISFEIPEPGRIELTVYDILGREVEVLADEFYQAGEHRIKWNGSTDPSGMYFYRLVTNDRVLKGKMLLLK